MEDIVRVVELKRIKARVFILGLGSVVWVSRRITTRDQRKAQFSTAQ